MHINWSQWIFKGLSQLGPFDLQTTVASKMKEPSEATMNIRVMRCLDFLIHLVFFPFSFEHFHGKALKNNPSKLV